MSYLPEVGEEIGSAIWADIENNSTWFKEYGERLQEENPYLARFIDNAYDCMTKKMDPHFGFRAMLTVCLLLERQIEANAMAKELPDYRNGIDNEEGE